MNTDLPRPTAKHRISTTLFASKHESIFYTSAKKAVPIGLKQRVLVEDRVDRLITTYRF